MKVNMAYLQYHLRTSHVTLPTWIQDFLCLGMAGAEWAVEFEVIGIVKEGTTQAEQDALQKIEKNTNGLINWRDTVFAKSGFVTRSKSSPKYSQ